MNKLVPPSPITTVAVSGGFDPIHKGHVRMIRAAAAFGEVIVIANSDEWLMRKKGYVFMPFEERAYFYLSPMLNTKVHRKTEKLQGAGRVTEKRP